MSSKVLPPANGKKLWRVKKTQPSRHNSISSNSTSNASLNSLQTSMECLNNSLKIAAAASKFTIKRPPLRRPKNRPGKPKDFVFVDLSPVQSEDSTNEEVVVGTEKKSSSSKPATPSSSRRSSSISSNVSVSSEPPATPMTANTSINSINDLPLPTNNILAPAAPIRHNINGDGFGLPSPVESLDDFLISEFDLWDNNWESIIPEQQHQQIPQPQPQQHIPQQLQQLQPPAPQQQQQSLQEFIDIVLIVQQQQEQIQQLQQQLQQITTIPSPGSVISHSSAPMTGSSISMSTNKYIDFSF